MDSMRSLNTSLPSSSTRRQRTYPPAGLHQAFKAAAFSVTQLYKAATANEDTARASGYQEAIDELLTFLDKENLGLGDGEGWKVRQWATERLTPDVYASESDDEVEDVAAVSADARVTQQTTSSERVPTAQSEQVKSEAVARPETGHLTFAEPPRPNDIFQFTANSQAIPQLPYHQPAEMDTGIITPERHNRSPRAVRLTTRSPYLSHARSSRDRATSTQPFGPGAGVKRRSPSHSDFDFVTFANYGHGAGGNGSAKRRRRGD